MNGEAGREKHFAEFVYDFAVDAGAQGAITLGTLPLGAIVTEVAGVVETLFASLGSATIILGTTDDDNGFIASTALAALVANAGIGTGIPATMQPITNDTASRDVKMTIGTADLTAGKARFVLGYYIPSNIAISE